MSDFPSSLQKCAKMGLVTHFKMVEGRLGEKSETHLPCASGYGMIWFQLMLEDTAASFIAFHRTEGRLALCREGSLLWLGEIPWLCLKGGK